MSVYKCSFRIYIIFYHRRPFNKTTATSVRPHPFSTLCTTPLGKMTLWNIGLTFSKQRWYIYSNRDNVLFPNFTTISWENLFLFFTEVWSFTFPIVRTHKKIFIIKLSTFPEGTGNGKEFLIKSHFSISLWPVFNHQIFWHGTHFCL